MYRNKTPQNMYKRYLKIKKCTINNFLLLTNVIKSNYNKENK